MTYLTIDQGNTRRKAAVWKDGRIVERHAGPADLGIFCSTASGLDAQTRLLARRWVMLGGSTPVPIVLHYSTLDTIGPDRIAAAVGARFACSSTNILVADVGTAVTYDWVRGKDFVGGNIGPGINMQLQAMHNHTAHLPNVDDETANTGCLFAHDTRQAMLKGVLCGIAGALMFYKHNIGGRCKIILTGGDAPKIAPFLTIDHTIEPDLVLKGLYRILKFNEDKL